MKKKHKILIIILSVLVVLCAVGTGTYQLAIKPRLETALEKAQKLMEDEEFQKSIDEFVKEMIAKGEMEEKSLEEYNMYSEAMGLPLPQANGQSDAGTNKPQ